MATKVDADTFVAAWERYGGRSPEIANALGMTERAVLSRRRSIEQQHKIALVASTPPRDTRLSAISSPAHHPARAEVDLKNGVVIVFSDAHFWPGEESTAFRGLLKLCAEIKPRIIVCNGDAFDGATISRFPRLGYSHRPTVVEELKAVDQALGKIKKSSKKSKTYWCLGNHDWRYEARLALAAPEYEGIAGFSLKTYFPDWLPCWSLWINGDVVIKHRYKGGIHATRNNAVMAGLTMITSHLHALKVTPFSDYRGTRWGVDTGCLSDTYPDNDKFEAYLEDNPRDWRSGFAILTFQDGRLCWPEVVYASDGEIFWRGQIVRV